MKQKSILQWTPRMLAERTGVTVPTLHFYEEKGLISATRNSGNQRRYDRSMIRRIAFIQAGQKAGITLNQIKTALDKLPKKRTPNKADWESISTEWTALLNERIMHLENLRDKMTSCVKCGCLSLDSCRLYNADDLAGKNSEQLNDWS